MGTVSVEVLCQILYYKGYYLIYTYYMVGLVCRGIIFCTTWGYYLIVCITWKCKSVPFVQDRGYYLYCKGMIGATTCTARG